MLGALSLASGLARASGPLPYAFASIVAGHDVPGCGARETPCRTAEYVYHFVLQPGGVVFVEDLGYFPEPTIFTTFGLMLHELDRRLNPCCRSACPGYVVVEQAPATVSCASR